MQFKEHEKVVINVTSGQEEPSSPDATSVQQRPQSGQSVDSGSEQSPRNNETNPQANNAAAAPSANPETTNTRSTGLAFSKISAALRMLNLNPVGMMCIFTVIAILISALIFPNLDKDANVDTAAWVSQITIADNALAAKASTVNKADAKALNSIALSYLLGDGVTVDHKKAIEYFQQSAKLGNTDAMLYYGILTHSHLRKQEAESQSWIAKAMAAGNPYALEYDLRRHLKAKVTAKLKDYTRTSANYLIHKTGRRFYSPHAPAIGNFTTNPLGTGYRKTSRPAVNHSKTWTPAEIKLRSDLCAQYRPLAELGDTDALWGIMRLSDSENQRYLDRLEQNAKDGDKIAQYLIGYRYVEQAWPNYWTSNSSTRSERIGGVVSDRMQVTSMEKYLLSIKYLEGLGNAGFVPAERMLNRAYNTYGDLFSDPLKNPQTFALHSQNLRRSDIASSWLKRAALQNDGPANSMLARRYYSQDILTSKRLEYGKIGLNNGGYSAHETLSDTYASEDLQPEAYREALAALGTTPSRLAQDVDEICIDADCDVGESVARAAVALKDGAGVTQDLILANRLMKRLANTGEPAGFGATGRFLLKNGALNESIPYLRKSNSAGSLYLLGKGLCCGSPAPAQMQQGLQALMESQRKGNPDASLLLGDIYYLGRGVATDEQLAVRYYVSAASKVDEAGQYIPWDTRQTAGIAMMRMGNIYERKEPTTANKQMAIAWYRNALAYHQQQAALKLKQMGEQPYTMDR